MNFLRLTRQSKVQLTGTLIRLRQKQTLDKTLRR